MSSAMTSEQILNIENEPEETTPPKRKRKPAAEPIPNPQDYVDAYNEILGNRLPMVVTLNDKRRKGLNRIVRQLATPNLTGWRAYLEAFSEDAGPFYFGKITNWIANFDYLLRETTLEKVRSGEIRGGEAFR